MGERETFLAYNTPRGMRNIDRSVRISHKVLGCKSQFSHKSVNLSFFYC